MQSTKSAKEVGLTEHIMSMRTMRDPYPMPDRDEGMGVMIFDPHGEPVIWYNTCEARTAPDWLSEAKRAGLQITPSFEIHAEAEQQLRLRMADRADEGKQCIGTMEVRDRQLVVNIDWDQEDWVATHPEAAARFRARMKVAFGGHSGGG